VLVKVEVAFVYMHHLYTELHCISLCSIFRANVHIYWCACQCILLPNKFTHWECSCTIL